MCGGENWLLIVLVLPWGVREREIVRESSRGS